ncbi:MAG: ECF transporter S component [Chloroflexi bacterium]|nr:ECF transporter S component [Chloroflexota bacterium]
MNGFRKEFSTFSIALMAVAIAINIGAGQIPRAVGLPLYLDSIGTVLVGVLVGPWAGALTGFLANVVWTFTGLFPQAIAWAGVAAIIGALAGVFAQSGWLKEWWRAALAGLITGVVAAILSAPIAAYVFGGVTGNAGTDAIVAAWRAAGFDALFSNVAQGTMSDPLDKIVTYLIVWAVLLALPQRLKARFGNQSGQAAKTRARKRR